jgi:hypothetical protein
LLGLPQVRGAGRKKKRFAPANGTRDFGDENLQEVMRKSCYSKVSGQNRGVARLYRIAIVAVRGRSSVVERQLPKLYVVGSIPIARSNTWQNFEQIVRWLALQRLLLLWACSIE